MPKYNPAEIEPRWQQFWEQQQTFRTPDLPADGQEKLYVLDMFPYPSGQGLHVGHPEGYTATDIVCRFERMRGKSVLHPMGFDAFGLPAEEHAIKTGDASPRFRREANIDNFTRQLKMLGFSYDWEPRRLSTTDEDYFRWTQWIFLVLYDTWFDVERQVGRPISELPIPPEVAAGGEKAVRRYQDQRRLAYQSDALVNWCPALGTVLANEEVIDGLSERGGHPVQRIPMRQWMLRITAYADRLSADLDSLDWPEGIKRQQTEWIGRSVGAEVDFYIGRGDEFDAWQARRREGGFPAEPGDDVLRVYTTRPDTLYGATYMVIAPEHPFVERLTTDARRAEVTDYCQRAASKSERERTSQAKHKSGVFTGAQAINPVNGQPTPIWIADYVLSSYGTGAIMAVPAHDTRDFEFARQFEIPVVAVVDPGEGAESREKVLAGEACFAGEGAAVHCGPYDGLPTPEFKRRMTGDLQAAGWGAEAVNYKLRDWLFSRQRFWGEPFPILHELDDQGRPTGCYRAVDASELPVDLPKLDDFQPHGRAEPPLAKADESWLYPVVDGRRYRRETNTMPQWAGSCWYYLRFIDPANREVAVDPVKERAWMPVDLYIGGAEHAVLHLLYSRFWHKVLYDRGHVSTPEPFQRLINQGIILGDVEYAAMAREDGAWVSWEKARKSDEGGWIDDQGKTLQRKALTIDDVVKQGEHFALRADPQIRVESKAYKMSKARGNVVNPDDIVRDFGADSLRVYEMFMGPLEATKPWSTDSVDGVRKFLNRAWRMIVDENAEQLTLSAAVEDAAPTREQNQVLHATIEAVTRDTAGLSFNTAVARMMEFVNFFTKQARRPRAAMESFALLLSPYAPHIAEELWSALGHADSLAYAPWPAFDPALVKKDTVEIPIQVMGKLRHRIEVPAGLEADELEQAALADPRVQELLEGKQLVKTIVKPGRLINFVAK